MRRHGGINLDPDPDVYLPSKRARREIKPRFMTPRESEQWRTGTLGKVPRCRFVPPTIQEQVAVSPAPPPERVCLEARRRRPAPRYLVAWRDEWDEAGERHRQTSKAAQQVAEKYNRPRCWAMVVDLVEFRVEFECGTRFADLPRGSLVKAEASPARKPVARAGRKEVHGKPISAARAAV